jgi:hypothetical protein
VECRVWSQPDANHWRGLCTNRFFPKTGTEGCPICVKPLTVSVECGGECFEGSPPAAIKVRFSGVFVAENGTDMSDLVGEFGLTRTGRFAQCCLYSGRSPYMKPITRDQFGNLLPSPITVADQYPDMHASICAGGSGHFEIRLAGSSTGAWDNSYTFPPAGFQWRPSLTGSDNFHDCESPWGLPHVSLTRGSPVAPFDMAFIFVSQVTPPQSVILWW